MPTTLSEQASTAPSGLAAMLRRCFGQAREMDVALSARSRLEGAARAAFERWETVLTTREAATAEREAASRVMLWEAESRLETA